MTTSGTSDEQRSIPQPVAAPLTRTAIFLVLTVNPAAENLATIRSVCRDLSALVRSVGHRVPDGELSCVMAFGSEIWDDLFGRPRPAELRKFREILAGERHAPSTPGDVFFHIRAQRMDLCFELATQVMSRLGTAVTAVDEVHGFRYFDSRGLIGFVDGTENPEGQAAHRRHPSGRRGPRLRRWKLCHRAEVSPRSGRVECAADGRARTHHRPHEA